MNFWEKLKAAVADVDLNGNGVPDYKDPAIARWAFAAATALVKTFASPHTQVYKAVVLAERAEQVLKGVQP